MYITVPLAEQTGKIAVLIGDFPLLLSRQGEKLVFSSVVSQPQMVESK